MRNDFSVGGVAIDSNGRIALIRTTNLKDEQVWGLPKGHPNDNESPSDAALREVAEETGLFVELTGGGPAASVNYWFVDRSGEKVHKRVDFYLMVATGGDTSNHDGEVDEVAMLDPITARKRLTYRNEQQALDDALDP